MFRLLERQVIYKSARRLDEIPSNSCTLLGIYEYNGKVYYDIHLDNHEEGIHFDVIPVEFINLTPHDIKLNDGTW